MTRDAAPWPLAILFDAAGTLIRLREPVGDSYARVAAAHGVSLPAWRIDDAFRRVVARATPRAFPDARRDQIAERERDWWRQIVRSTFLATDSTVRFADFDAFFADLYDEYEGATRWALVDGARELLATLREGGHRLGVVSNFDLRLPGVLAALGIADAFETIVLPADCGVEKPDPRIFELALARMGVAAADTVYVGDDDARDAEGAARAGLSAVRIADLDSLAALPKQLATLRASRAPNRSSSR